MSTTYNTKSLTLHDWNTKFKGMSTLDRNLNRIANVAIVIVAVLLSVVLAKNHLLPLRSTDPSVKEGTRLDVKGFDWQLSDQTLIIALQPGCRFCAESAPFYRRLAEAVQSRKVALIAVLPTAEAESVEYLRAADVPIASRRANLRELGVVATPTLLLVDSRGTVKRVWRGKLRPQAESEVLTLLNNQGG